MKKVLSFFLSLFLVLALYSKQDLNLKPLNGQETANYIQTIYNELGPRIGSHLVEPNVVITLAGLRGYANFLMHDLTQEEENRINEFNIKHKNSGLLFTIIDDKEDEIVDILITNLKGYEYTSKISKLPFVVNYDASSGFQGKDKWSKKIKENIKNYFNDTKEYDQHPESHLHLGLMLGYPDQALLDMYNNIKAGLFGNNRAFIYSKIPYSDYYDCPQPNFSYFKESIKDETIVNVEKSWGKLLEEFYTSTWHKALSKDPIFIKIRQSEDEAHEQWFKKMRLDKN
ncbi:MAG: hypothetical protein P4L22_01925 [Candidatus Babeliales bacterium]|nr:hypothetical protein [Candidatus Babeliales bacterium]